MPNVLDPTRNFGKVVPSGGYDASQSIITLQSGNGALLPQPSTEGAFNLVWWNSTDYSDPSDDPSHEIVRVTARATDTLTVTRGQESTTAVTHNTGGKVYLMILPPTRKMMSDIATNLLVSVSLKTANYSMSASDGLIEVDTSAGAVTITLPPIASAFSRRYSVKKVSTDTNNLTVQGDVNIDGAATQIITFRSTIEVVPNSSLTGWDKT